MSGTSLEAAALTPAGSTPDKGVDDTAKQDRLDELGNGQHDIGKRQRAGEADLRAEQREHAQVST